MKFTSEQKQAIKRICKEYDFEDTKELKHWLKEEYGDNFDGDWFNGKTEAECYDELVAVIDF